MGKKPTEHPANPSDRTVVYTWESELRTPVPFLRHSLSELMRARQISYRIFRRDLSAQYRETLLGLLWLWVPALTVAGSFVLASQANLISVDNTLLPYPAYVLISTILWQVFAETVAAPLRAIDVAKPLLSRVSFPAEAVILARVWDVGLSLLIKVPLLIAVLAWYRIPVGWELCLFPIGLFSLFAFGLFVGLILVPVGGLYQDVSKSLPLALTFWMFLTPVVFSAEVGGALGWIVRFNPVTHILVATRGWLTAVPEPHITQFVVLSVVGVLGALVSWLVVRLAIPILVERAGN